MGEGHAHGAAAAGQVAPLPPALAAIAERIAAASASGTPLEIVGAGSKRFYGRAVGGVPLALAGYRGIVAYEPTELVVTARAGTPLAEIEDTLAASGQMLGFEPPHFGPASTLGGAVASGLSGPARPYHGAVRDFVLGIEMLDGRGRLLRFGGQVMKNVAGFDVSRVLAGSLGTLGVLAQVSLRVLPRPPRVETLCWDLDPAAARARMESLARAPWPLTAMVFDGARLHVRVAGSAAAVEHAVAALGADEVSDDTTFWRDLRDLRLPSLSHDDAALWRVSVPPAAPSCGDFADVLLEDWGGAQRWVRVVDDGARLRAWALALGGHATCVRSARGAPHHDEPFTPPAPAALALMQRLKAAFDPAGILNPGRLYSGL